jgi:hypothetical protein
MLLWCFEFLFLKGSWEVTYVCVVSTFLIIEEVSPEALVYYKICERDETGVILFKSRQGYLQTKECIAEA